MSEFTDTGFALMDQTNPQRYLNYNQFVLAMTQLRKGVVSRTETTPPSPVDNTDAYIVPAGAGAPWDTHENDIAYGFGDVWNYLPPIVAQGEGIYVIDDDERVRWDPLAGPAAYVVLGIGADIHGATDKPIPVDADELPLADSAAGFSLKKLTWTNVKATLKTYFDTLYGSGDGDGDVVGPAGATANAVGLFDGATGKLLKDSATTISTDGTFATNSDALLPTEKAIKTYVGSLIAAADAMVFKTVIDCSANPDYPAADCGWTYRVSVAGKIGGGSGPNVQVGDILICIVDGTASGNHATVGANWTIIQADIDGALTTASIGSTVQAWAAKLDALVALTWAADKLAYFTSASAVATTDLSSFIRGLLDDADAATARGTLGAAARQSTINTQTGSYTLVLADGIDTIVEMSVASANNLTVPPNSSVAFLTGTSIPVAQYGAGQTSIVAGAGVTIRSSGGKLKLTGQYSGASLYKRGTDEWLLVGDIAT